MGTIWIFVYYAVYGSGRGRCRDFLVLKWGGGGLNLQIWDLNRAHETERTVFSAKFLRNFAVLWWVAKIHISQSVRQSVSQSVSHSVNSGGWCKFRTLCLNVIRTKVLIKITRIYWSLVIQQCMLLFVPMGKTVKWALWHLMRLIVVLHMFCKQCCQTPPESQLFNQPRV